MINLKKPSHLFWLFFVIYTLVWTITPSLVRFVTPMDATEGAMWGQVLQWGYSRDPWLNALLTKLALVISHDNDWSIYLLSQLMCLLAVWSVWRLGRLIFKNDALALVGTIILVVIQYYNIGIIDFNDNTCLLGLWPLMMLYFYRSLTASRLKHWLLLGIISGVAMMAKYYTAVPLATMFLFMLYERENYKFFKDYKLYLAILLLIAISLPHVWWLIKYDFVPFQFVLSVLDRHTESASFYTKHVGYAIHFFLAQIAAFMGAVAVFLFGYFGKVSPSIQLNDEINIGQFNVRFLFYVGVAPTLLTVLISMASGWHIYTMWGIPLQSLWGLILIAITKPILSYSKIYRIIAVCALVTLLLIIGYSFSMKQSKTSSGNYPAREIAEIVTEKWHHRYHTKLDYVGGYNRPVSYMARYSSDRPEGLIEFNPALNPGLDMARLKEKGAVFILIPQMEGADHFSEAIIKTYPELIITPVQEVNWKRHKLQQTPMTFQLAFLPPSNHLNK